VKGLLETNEVDYQCCIPLCALLHDIMKCKYLVNASPALSETCLFLPLLGIDSFLYPAVDNSAKDFAGDGEQGDASPVITIL